MARNEEKHLTQLNRLHLQKLREEEVAKNPPRPHLRNLNSEAEIKKWLPSIKRDIHIALSQSQVPCYTDTKVQEYRSEVDRLQREYMAFIRKLRTLNPKTEVTPWTSRGYKKRKSDESGDESRDDGSSSSLTKRLSLPIMEKPCNSAVEPPAPVSQPDNQDLPLNFSHVIPRGMDLEAFTRRQMDIENERRKSWLKEEDRETSRPSFSSEKSISEPAAQKGMQDFDSEIESNLDTRGSEHAGSRTGCTMALVADYGSSDEET